jgi:hypothetical protein
VPVLVGRLDDEAGEAGQPVGLVLRQFGVEHGVGADGQSERRCWCVAVGEERAGGEHHAVGGEGPRRGVEFDVGTLLDHGPDQGVDDGAAGGLAGSGLRTDVGPRVEVARPVPLVDAVEPVGE